LAEDGNTSRNLAAGYNWGYNWGVRCDDNGICTGVTLIGSPDSLSPEAIGSTGQWGYDYVFVDGLDNGYGNYPGNDITEKEKNTIWKAHAQIGLEVKIGLYQTSDGENICRLLPVEYGFALGGCRCSWEECENYGIPCVGKGCGSGDLEGPRAIRYDCTGLEIDNFVGSRLGLYANGSINRSEGCAPLTPFVFPFDIRPGNNLGGTGPDPTEDDKSSKKGKKGKVGKKGKADKKGKAGKKAKAGKKGPIVGDDCGKYPFSGFC